MHWPWVWSPAQQKLLTRGCFRASSRGPFWTWFRHAQAPLLLVGWESSNSDFHFLLSFFLSFWDKVSGWPLTHYRAQVGLKLVILLPPPLYLYFKFLFISLFLYLLTCVYSVWATSPPNPCLHLLSARITHVHHCTWPLISFSKDAEVHTGALFLPCHTAPNTWNWSCTPICH
jgi:hypothetical protein